MELYYAHFLSLKEISVKLRISVSTVKRDLRKIKRFVTGQKNRAWRLIQAENDRAHEKEFEGLSDREKFDYLSAELEKIRHLVHNLAYKGHYTILYLDMMQPDKYGIPKLTLLPRQTVNTTLAYPHRVRVVVKGNYEGQLFEADLSGFNITQRFG